MDRLWNRAEHWVTYPNSKMSSNFDKHLGETIFYVKNLQFIKKTG